MTYLLAWGFWKAAAVRSIFRVSASQSIPISMQSLLEWGGDLLPLRDDTVVLKWQWQWEDRKSSILGAKSGDQGQTGQQNCFWNIIS